METALKYRVIWVKADGRRKTRYPSTPRKVAGILRSLDTVEVDLRVIYIRDGQEIGENSGHYEKREDWLTAWAAFNDPEIAVGVAGWSAEDVQRIYRTRRADLAEGAISEKR